LPWRKQKIIKMIAVPVCVRWAKQNKKGHPLSKFVIGNKTCAHGPGILIPTPPLSQTEISSLSDAEDDKILFSSDIESKNPQPFNQSELNDLVRDLDLT
jgi:hypothetical protein